LSSLMKYTEPNATWKRCAFTQNHKEYSTLNLCALETRVPTRRYFYTPFQYWTTRLHRLTHSSTSAYTQMFSGNTYGESRSAQY